MKKKYMSFLAYLFFVLNAFTQNANPFIEFIYNNPFLERELYFSNPELLRGKILKTSTEDYDISSDGVKSYGDVYGSVKLLSYFFFNNDNILEKEYFISINEEDGIPNTIKINSFQYDEDTVLVSYDEYSTTLYKNFYKSKQEKEEYTVEYDKEKDCKLYKYYDSNRELIKEIQVTKGKKTIKDSVFVSEPLIRIYTYEDNKCEEKLFYGEELLGILMYKNGVEICHTQETYKNTGKLVFKTDFNESFNEGISVTQTFMDGVLSKEQYTGKVSVEYNPAGFVEYKKIIPYEGEGAKGSYSIYNAEILDSEDEFLLEILAKIKNVI